MNETLRLLDRRTSLRTYADGLISRKQVDAILSSAMRAPTAGNMMLYSILEVDEPATRHRLAETCGHAFIAEAPLVLIFLADVQRWVDLFEADDVPGTRAQAGEEYRTPDLSKLLMACCDALIAAQNSVIAAESLGVGSCYVGDIIGHAEAHQDLLDLPPFAFPIAMVCYGNPPEGHKPRPTERFEARFIHHRERYRRFSGEELHAMTTGVEEEFAAVLQRKSLGFAELVYRGFLDSGPAAEQRRSVEILLRGWQSQR